MREFDQKSVAPTDVLVAGLPSALMDWTIDLVARFMDRHHAAVAHLPFGAEVQGWLPANSVSDLGARLFTGDFLPESWVAPIRNGQLIAVLVFDDIGVVWERLRGFGQEAVEATHNFVAVATALGDIAGSRGVLTVLPSDRADLASLATRILSHIGMTGGVADMTNADSLVASPITTPADMRPVTETVLRPAFTYGCSGRRLPVTWSRDSLFWGDDPGTRLPRVLDLTGPSRILAYGPYLALPPGRWTMSTVFALSPASQGTILSLTLHGPQQLGRIEFTVECAGLFKAVVPVVVASPREKLEIRLVTERGAIEGTIGIDDIVFTAD